MRSFKNPIDSDSKKKAFAFALLSALGLIIYSNTFNAPFAFDDQGFIEESVRIRGLRNFLDVSGQRYFTELTFALNYAAGGFNTLGYHLVNIAVHISNAVFVYLLVSLTFKTPLVKTMRGYGDAAPFAQHLPLAVSLIFLTHPVQTQAVTYLSQRCTSLATFFYLISILMYIKSRLASLEGYGGATKGGRAGSWVFYLGAILFTAVAQKTKEISFTLPLIITLYEFTFFDGATGLRKRIAGIIPLLLTLLIIPLGRFFAEAGPSANAGLFGSLDMLTRESKDALSRHDYLVTQFRVIVTYLRLLVFPVNQNLDYDYPKFRSLFVPEVFLSFLLLCALFLSAVYLYIRSRRSGNLWGVFIAFGILWFFLTLSVESSVIPIADVIFEHRLYLPGIGVMFSFSAMLFYMIDRGKAGWGLKRAVPAVIAVIVLAGSFATFKRNIIWSDRVALWRDVVKKSPGKARAYNNLGYELYRDGLAGEAIGYLEAAIRLQPDYELAYLNLGDALSRLGRYGEAAEPVKTALRLNPYSYRANFKMGSVLSQAGNYSEAVEYYGRAVRIRPDFSDAYVNLANALVPLKRLDDAIELYRKVLVMSPDNAYAKANLATVLKMKRLGEQG